jgi:hypothetical protein
VSDPRGRAIQWAALTVTQGEVLDAFAVYCREALDDVTVLEESPTRLLLGWKRERGVVELASGLAITQDPTPVRLVLTDLDDALVERFLEDEQLRGRVAVYDLDRLCKVNAVRSSVFVYFEWFLRDLYGVKVMPASSFTQGLVERGIISLGMG